MRSIKPETLTARGGQVADGSVHPVVPPLLAGTTFVRDNAYQLAPGASAYIRGAAPSEMPAEALLAELEKAHAAALFASGTAAAAAIVQSLSPGDRVIAPRIMYWGLRNWMLDFCSQWGIALDFYNAADPGDLARILAQKPTQMVWLETPSNPTWEVSDIAAASSLAKSAGAWLVVDSTVATPVLTQPIALGADLVFHSATKYLNGHSDVIAGAVVTAGDSAIWQRVLHNRTNTGAVLGAFEAWLLLRGMRTLFPRVKLASANALKLATALGAHPKVIEVQYPGLNEHSAYAVSIRQMCGGFGGMLSIRVAGGREAALAVASRCKVFLRATSLGGVESLIEHRQTIEGEDSLIPEDLLRLSVGIEAYEDLLEDLQLALG
ncbi:MAG: trans-sulfuration enzyme family protein [Granulosicoccaceae bacterium]